MSSDVLNSPARLAALAASRLLDTPPEPAFDRIAKLVTRLLRTPIALVTLIDPDRQFFKSGVGLPPDLEIARETPLSHSFCQHVVATDEKLIVIDARSDDRVSSNPAIRDLEVIAYLGVPIHDPSGATLGSLCAIEHQPREWSSADIAAIGDLAAMVESEIALRDHARRANALAETNAVLAREYQHRVKNTLAVASALIALSGREARDAATFAEIVQARLAALSSAQDLIDRPANAPDLRSLLERLLLAYRSEAISLHGPEAPLSKEQVTPLCLIVHELATNSAKYGAIRSGRDLAIDWGPDDGGSILLRWIEETDISEPQADGFGAKLIQTAARQLGASIDIKRESSKLRVTLAFRPGG